MSSSFSQSNSDSVVLVHDLHTQAAVYKHVLLCSNKTLVSLCWCVRPVHTHQLLTGVSCSALMQLPLYLSECEPVVKGRNALGASSQCPMHMQGTACSFPGHAPVQQLSQLVEEGDGLEDVEGDHAQVVGEARKHKGLPPPATPAIHPWPPQTQAALQRHII